jgi:hypothetical protein
LSTDLSSQYLFAGDHPILSVAEAQSYLYGLPEDAVPPTAFTQWVVSGKADPDELARCLAGEAREAAASSDESLEILRLAQERLRAAFPDPDA